MSGRRGGPQACLVPRLRRLPHPPRVLVLLAFLPVLVGCAVAGETQKAFRNEAGDGGVAGEVRGEARGKTGPGPGSAPGAARPAEKGVTVGDMSVREMVGQMFVVAVGGTGPDYHAEKMVRERNIGGVILFAHNMRNEEQTDALTSSLQNLSMRTEPAVPLFVAVDQEGGDIGSAPWVAPQPAAARVGAASPPRSAGSPRR